ncbi:hypothetical protein GCM10020369_36170 [Cryptosporangium minutisporangium]|uniref:Mutator family transposase n=1 Tax=Cryptosporangium minutisporangium TaxID=113569 RepID=A0ABP6SZT7_9ACTN
MPAVGIASSSIHTSRLPSATTPCAARSFAAIQSRFEEFDEVWGGKYPAIVRLWRNAWEQFVPFLDFPPELHRLIYTTNAIESLNARFPANHPPARALPQRPAALKVLYLVIRSPRPNRANVTGKPAAGKAS